MFSNQTVDDGIKGEFVTPRVNTQLKRLGQPEFPNSKCNDSQIFIEFFFELNKVATVVYAFVESAGELGSYGLDRDRFPRIMAKIRSNSTGLCGVSVSSIEISVTKLSRPFLVSTYR
jgi:hypothetical protein